MSLLKKRKLNSFHEKNDSGKSNGDLPLKSNEESPPSKDSELVATGQESTANSAKSFHDLGLIGIALMVLEDAV